MCIEDEAAGKLQTMRIVKEIEVRLIPSLFLKATLYKFTVLVSLLELLSLREQHGPFKP